MSHSDELEGLAATPTILRRLLADNPPSTPSGDEGWTAREIAAHLRDCEEFFLLRYGQMAHEDTPALTAFDQDALAHDRNYAATDLSAALDAFEQLRGRSLALLSALSERDWQRAGMHEESGRITIESHARHNLSHDLVHLRQVSESLGGK